MQLCFEGFKKISSVSTTIYTFRTFVFDLSFIIVPTKNITKLLTINSYKMKRLKNILVFSIGLTVMSLFLSCEKEEDIVSEVESETISVQDSEINATNKASSTFWSPWLTNNPNGVVRPANIFNTPETNVFGFKVFEQAGYGIVNLGIRGKNPNNLNFLNTSPEWATTNFNGQYKIMSLPFKDHTITTGIEVKEQYGYGIVDMRLFDENNKPSYWITYNPNVTRYRSYRAPTGYKIVGIQTKEQAGFGIIDIRVYVRKI